MFIVAVIAVPLTVKLVGSAQSDSQVVTESKKDEQEETSEKLIRSTHSLAIEVADAEILLKVAMAEAEGETVKGKALVMLVVLNRAKNDDFPDTIEAVVFQRNQFVTVKEGGRYWTTEPDEGCYEALELVLSGWDESYGALYFESCSTSSWHSQNLILLFEYGNHRFYT